MPISNDFTCPSGHSFSAIAKLRARCPQCGKMARREFQKSTSSEEKSQSTSSPITSTTTETPITSQTGSKPVTTTKKESQSESGTSESRESTESTKRLARVIRQGKVPTMPKSHKKPTPKAKPKIEAKSSSPVSHRKIHRAGHPVVKGMPEGSRQHKLEDQDNRPFWQKVKETYFR